MDKVGRPANKVEKKNNYKQLYFEVLDSIVGMLSERFQDDPFWVESCKSKGIYNLGWSGATWQNQSAQRNVCTPIWCAYAWEPNFFYLQGYGPVAKPAVMQCMP